AEFGRMALASKDVDAMQREACRLAALHLDAARALVLRREPGRRELGAVATTGFDTDRLDKVLAMVNERWRGDGGLVTDEPIVFDPPEPAPPPDARVGRSTAGLMLCAIPGEDGCAGLIGACAAGRRNF